MAFNKLWNALTGKNNDETPPEPESKNDIIPLASEAFPVVKISERQLSSYKQIPLASLASLGSVFSKLPEGARTIVQTVQKNVALKETLYVGINPNNIQGYIQANAFGENGNIMRINEQGKHVIAARKRYKAIDTLPIDETITTKLPIDPMMMVVAVALISLEQKLDSIQKSVENVLQFLKQEKQSKQRGNLNMLAEIMEDYKLNNENEKFCMSRATEVLAIKTTAYQDIDFYQNQIATELQKQKGIHGMKNSQNLLDSVTYQFAEYQLACHLFAFSSFLDIMLHKNFDAQAIQGTIEKMLTMAARYGALYDDCHSQIQKYQRTAIEAKIIDGVAIATKGLGKAIAAVPVIRDGSVDEALINAGDTLKKYNQESIEQNLLSFETFDCNRMTPFIENLQSVSLLYNAKNAMITDGETLYILQTA